MDTERLIGFGLALLIASITPGPNNFILATSGSMFGFVRTLPLLCGVVAGFSGLISIAAWGVGGLLSLYADELWWIGYIGVLMLWWLSYKIATAPVGVKLEDRKDTLMLLVRSGFLGMVSFQFINPKGIPVAFALTSSFIDPQAEEMILQLFVIMVISISCAILSGVFWTMLGSFVGKWLKSYGRERGYNIVMSILLFSSTLMILYGLQTYD